MFVIDLVENLEKSCLDPVSTEHPVFCTPTSDWGAGRSGRIARGGAGGGVGGEEGGEEDGAGEMGAEVVVAEGVGLVAFLHGCDSLARFITASTTTLTPSQVSRPVGINWRRSNRNPS